MTVLNCENCTATLRVVPNQAVVTCEFCGTSKVLGEPHIVPPHNASANGAASHSHVAPTVSGTMSHHQRYIAPGFNGVSWAPFPRHNAFVHIVLAFFTCGVGNVLYFLAVAYQQQRWREIHNVSRWNHFH